MRILVLSILMIFCGDLYAHNYYFSSASGNDSRTVIEAQSPSTPWKTISKLNSISNILKPGDFIYFKADDVFDGSIQITASGNAGNVITFSSYGNGAKPIINGLTKLVNWTIAGEGKFETVSSAIQTNVNTLLIDGIPQQIGRYPNSTDANKGYLTIQNTNGHSQISDPKLSSSPNWTNGEIVIRKNRWVIDRNIINSHSGNSIYYTSETGYPTPKNYGYFIQNHPGTLDHYGEWYCKAQDRKLGIYLGDANISSLIIEASTVETLVAVNNQGHIVFDNLSFKGANNTAIDLRGAQNIRINSCDILFSGVNGINAAGANNVTIENSVIYSTNNNAFNGTNCTGITIRNNKITNTGLFAGMGKGGDGNYEAIVIDGDNELIELNEIINTGYIPITFRGNVNTIRNNFINNFALVKDDGGAIYTWNNLPNAPLSYGTKINGNIVLNGKGAGEGTDDPAYLAANGIYMDDNTANVEISGNTVANCALKGIYIHNAHELTLENNTFFNNNSQVQMTYDGIAAYSRVRNIGMHNNIFFSKENNQPVAEFYSINNDIADFGEFNNNYYCRPTYDSYVITAIYNNGANTKTLNLEAWKTLFGKDKASNKSPVSVPSFDFVRFEYNATPTFKTIVLDGKYLDVKNKSYSGTISLSPYSSLVLLKQATLTSQCPLVGGILREQWDGINGVNVSNIPLETTPDNTAVLSGALEVANVGDNYGARLKGYLCPPQNGKYIFSIAGDDAAELLLSTDDNPANKSKIASVATWTYFRQWNVSSSQTSQAINLQAGHRYYIEVLQKEGVGGDHVSVAWQLPSGEIEAPIPAIRLSPYGITSPGKSNQTIDFGSLPNKILGDVPFIIAASSSSSLPVSFRVISGPAILLGTTISLTSVGPVVIEASQSGDDNFHAATPITQSFVVSATPEVPSPPTCSSTGSILYEQWNDLSGTNLDNIAFLQTTPGSVKQLNLFEGPTDVANNYGSRIRGFICPPLSGNYTFWISGDDASELWLSTDEDPAKKVRIADILSWTYPREWNKFPSQKSRQIYLQTGVRYYIEALHKEGGGGDNLAVAWQLPNGIMEAPIAGNRLSPYTFMPPSNPAPIIKSAQSITFASLPSKILGEAPFTINASASSGLQVSFRVVTGPASSLGNTLTLSGIGTVLIEASQAGDDSYTAAISVTRSFIVTAPQVPSPSTCAGTGSILYEQWNGLSDNNLDNISFLNTSPAISYQLTLFEGPTDAADNYGSRIRGYICPPRTGNYTFWISGDDASELWLSTDDNPDKKIKIADILSWTSPREWNKFPSQKSAQIYLQAGVRYYIEALHKEGGGGDNLAVAWQLPDGVLEAPITANRLLPYITNDKAPDTKINQTINFSSLPAKTFGDPPFIINASASSGLPVSFHIVSGPATIADNVVMLTGAGLIEIEASRSGNDKYNGAPSVRQSFTVSVSLLGGSVPPPSFQTCLATGSIIREQWNNVEGTSISDIPFQRSPSSTNQLISLESSTSSGDHYGARIRGYICPPQSGNYVFFVSGDDAVELWLSTDDNPANKIKIAGNLTWVNYRDFNQYASQKSAPVTLQQGHTYYIEVLHKEGVGGDFLTVAWQLPNGITEMPIPGNRLSHYDVQSTTNGANDENTHSSTGSDIFEGDNLEIQAYPNPFRNQAIIKVKPVQSEAAQLSIFDIQGRWIKDLFKGGLKSGAPNIFVLKASGLSEGVYTIRLVTTTRVISKKIILVK